MKDISSRIVYSRNTKISVEEFIDVLKRSTLDARRPVGDKDRIKSMLDHANVIITAWDQNTLVGVSRALSDFSFCCYLSDLAVDVAYQKQGIGKRLIEETHAASGLSGKLILLAAPAATEYYPKIGMEKFPHCFVIQEKTE